MHDGELLHSSDELMLRDVLAEYSTLAGTACGEKTVQDSVTPANIGTGVVRSQVEPFGWVNFRGHQNIIIRRRAAYPEGGAMLGT